MRQARDVGVDVLAHQVLHELPRLGLVSRLVRDADAPRCVGDAALAGVAICGGNGRDAELQVGVRLSDRRDVCERVDHHAHLPVGELGDLVRLLKREGAVSDDLRVVEGLHVVDRALDAGVGEIRLTLLEHASTRGPQPRHHVVLNAVRVGSSQRQDPALRRGLLGDRLGVGQELVASRRRRCHACLSKEVVVGEEGVHEVDDRDHVRRSCDLDLAGQLAVVVLGGFDLGAEVVERTLLDEVVHPGSVEPDHVGECAGDTGRCGLILQGRVGLGEELDGDVGVLGVELVGDLLQISLGELGAPPLGELDGDLASRTGGSSATACRGEKHGGRRESYSCDEPVASSNVAHVRPIFRDCVVVGVTLRFSALFCACHDANTAYMPTSTHESRPISAYLRTSPRKSLFSCTIRARKQHESADARTLLLEIPV